MNNTSDRLFYFNYTPKTMFYFYVLYSLKDGKLYKGYSEDVAQRFLKHASGATKSTKHRRPLILIHIEQFESKEKAMERERWSKSLEGGATLRAMLKEKNILNDTGKLNGSSTD